MSEGFNQFRRQVSKGLESKRWSLKSAIAMVLFGAIILVFVFFGFPSKMANSGGAGSAAAVNKTLISLADLRSESSRIEQVYAPLFGGNLGDAQRQFVMQQALETLINQELIYQMAGKEGVLATDNEIQEIIMKDIGAFQKNGRFQRDLYFGVLEANRLSPADFEQKIRKERVGIRAQKLFEASATPLMIEVSKLQALQQQKYNVAFVQVDKDIVTTKMPVAAGDVEKRMSDAAFAGKIQEYYNLNKAEFTTEEQVNAQHILIKSDDKRNEKQALEEINKIAEMAKKEDFGKLAAKYSEDQGSKDKKGELGYFGRGKMDPEFENAAFTQKPGEVGKPIKTMFGYHLIKVLDKKAGGQKSFDSVKSEIARKLVATEAYEGQLKSLEEAVVKGDSLTVEAQIKKMGVGWQETGFFDLASDSIPKLSSTEATKAAFQVNESQKFYPQIVRDGTKRFVLKLKEQKKESAQDAQQVRIALSKERAMDLFRSWVESGKKMARIERNTSSLMK